MLHSLFKKINPFWLVMMLCGLNLLVMHYYIFYTCGLGGWGNSLTFANNFFSIIVDTCAIFLFFYFLCATSVKISLHLTFYCTLLWSFANVLYSRFFQQYISFSAIGQGDSLIDWLMIRIVINGIRLFDCYYVFSLLSFYLLIKFQVNPKQIILKLLSFLFSMLVLNIGYHVFWCSLKPDRRFLSYCIKLLNYNHFYQTSFSLNPNYYCFEKGNIRSFFAEINLNFLGTLDLTDDLRLQIYRESTKYIPKFENTIDSTTNVIFILVESYMSFTSDLKVNGKEVTPFMNSLKNDSTTFYNGKMLENVTIGESSDGQFVYMTGILPLRSTITVSRATHTTLPGLPKVLKRESRMIIPTIKSMWNQDEMCKQYGFDSLYSSDDYIGEHDPNLNDEQVFKMAMELDKMSKQPFLSVVLTMSMHQPYTEQIDSTFLINIDSIQNDLACYLNVCHYTDQQIQKYFDHLKQTGLYNNSLIVVAADHRVHNTNFGGVGKYIPLYIVNKRIMREKMWNGECNQLDVYTTLLDFLGCKSNWYGLGCSLASPNYEDAITSNTWNVAEWIIKSNYFAK